jgi:hypothetical protein
MPIAMLPREVHDGVIVPLVVQIRLAGVLENRHAVLCVLNQGSVRSDYGSYTG